MKSKIDILGACVAMALLPTAVNAQTLYSQNFDVDDSANWTVNSSGVDYIANAFYDYSAIGVPAAPGGTSTVGLKLTANNTSGVFGGVSMSPTGQSFSGSYMVTFDMWQNYVGPLGPGGSGTTQLSEFGIGTAGTTAAWAGSTDTASGANGVFFAATLDGGSASDFRAYSSAAATSYPSGNAVYQAPGGAINNSSAYYSVFTSQTAPGGQLSLYPGQTGSTDVGETSFLWRSVTILVDGGFATWSVDGLPIAKVDLSTVTLGGGDILFGQSDSNSGSSSDPNASVLNVTLIDNVVVTAVPEPTTCALVGLGAAGLFLARRRNKKA